MSLMSFLTCNRENKHLNHSVAAAAAAATYLNDAAVSVTIE